MHRGNSPSLNQHIFHRLGLVLAWFDGWKSSSELDCAVPGQCCSEVEDHVYVSIMFEFLGLTEYCVGKKINYQ